ncbi:hypothetical protein O181_085828 [Austropuccinia psidii MF-1]|uniref:Uncharacterized protein n=1 Tax=Austropuccinia psidii MF-1 TaxID=1389203 RepID=A0A9Q3ILT8_9BASI|nr:hypothetical protein [Austropuccinia psidii MF-1]
MCSLIHLITLFLKVFLSRSTRTKVIPPSKPLLYLGPEDYPDEGQFFYPQINRIVANRDYTQTMIKFYYYSPDVVNKSFVILLSRSLTTSPLTSLNTYATIPLQLSSPKIKIPRPPQPTEPAQAPDPEDMALPEQV